LSFGQTHNIQFDFFVLLSKITWFSRELLRMMGGGETQGLGKKINAFRYQKLDSNVLGNESEG
jgi:hypothetical protein